MTPLPSTPAELSTIFQALHQTRRDHVAAHREPRSRLTPADRQMIFAKAGGRCHICGGLIDGSSWDADHVQSHSTGGQHALDNYLPAHATCNQYRWNFSPEEFQYILKLGVWLRTQIEHETPLGMQAAGLFLSHELRRSTRRRGSKSIPNQTAFLP